MSRKLVRGGLAAASLAFAISVVSAAPFFIAGSGAANVDTNPATNVVLNSAIGGTITDLNISVNITGGHMEDFDLFLTSPGGTVVQFRADFGGGQNPFVHIGSPLNALFDDESANPHSAQSAGAVGNFQPFSLLSAFDGESLLGNWTLSILDALAPNEANTLVAWSISGTTDAAAVPEPASLALIGLGLMGLGFARRKKV